MAKVRVRELREYRALFEEVSDAKDVHQLAQIAARTDRLSHWLLLESMKTKLVERATKLGIPCRRDRERCFSYLLTMAKPQKDLFGDASGVADGR